MSIFTYQNAIHRFKSHILSKTVHSSAHCNRFQPSISNSLRVPASILKNAQKRPFSHYRRLRFARGSCFDANDTLYSRPFFTLSNRLYRMSLRPTITEQSARDPSAAGPFFTISVFPVSKVKRMAHVRTCHRRPVARTGPKI